MLKNQIRNFAIIAHIDHGKSTLADRILEITGAVEKRVMQQQFLDSNPISRERGITIKLAPVRLVYRLSSTIYHLNLIDTPGHVDFSYEVSRSLSACEGAILLVDATQGIQAQTLAHANLAKKLGLKIIPVINKIDLPEVKVEEVKSDLENIFGFKREEVLLVSAKTGAGVNKILEKVIEIVPPPSGTESLPLRALIFDSVYDDHQGIIAYVKVVDGKISLSDKDRGQIKFLESSALSHFLTLGFFSPKPTPSTQLATGEVGFIATGIKNPESVRIGDTLTFIPKGQNPKAGIYPLPGYQELKPMVFLGLYPKGGEEFSSLGMALAKLHLNDSSFSYSSESSQALGNGYRLGTLGVLHGEIIKERLFREFNLDLVTTIPTVSYQYQINSKIITINNANDLPDLYQELFEPWVKITIFSPQNYLGGVMTLCQEKRAKLIDLIYLSGGQVELLWEMPLSEMIINFYDKLKSVSSGFATLDYEFSDYKKFAGVKLKVLINSQEIDAMSLIVSQEKAYHEAQGIAQKLKELIPKQQFEVRIQVSDRGRILASQTISAYRKDVIAKLYGGDRTRKDKLLETQKKGKKKMKQIGKVSLPDEVFMAFYKI
ncbi:elongation factor 4 [Candidatus Gottesmanbacteria bacterium]|nr:elongation factor 4 [Candidatus Gottesmanbacteria bacterium]